VRRRPSRRALVGGLIAAAIGLLPAAGCGDDESDAVRAAFRELRRAFLTEDYGGVCARMSRAARREVGALGHELPSTCPQDMRGKMSAAILSPRDRADPKIESVEVDGDRATVLAMLGGTTPGVVRFVKHDGAWKLAQLFGTTAPPPPDIR
jgi:hypothetical protein